MERRARGQSAAVLGAVALLLGAACAPPAPRRRGAARCCTWPARRRARSRGSTQAGGAPAGPAVALGEKPAAVIPGAGGRLLALTPATAVSAATHIATDGGPALRAVPLDPGARVLLAAGDERRLCGAGLPHPGWHHHGPALRLVLVDLATGSAGRTHAVCADGEVATGLALVAGPGGPLAYLGLWSAGPAGTGRAGGSIVELDAVTGAQHPLLSLEGAPTLLATATPERPRRLCYAETIPGPPGDAAGDWRATDPVPARWQLVVLDLEARAPEAAHALPDGPAALALAPDRPRRALPGAPAQPGRDADPPDEGRPGHRRGRPPPAGWPASA